MWCNVQLTYQCDVEHTSSMLTGEYHQTTKSWWLCNNECTIAVHLANLAGNVLTRQQPYCARLWSFTIEQTGQTSNRSVGNNNTGSSEVEYILRSTYGSWMKKTVAVISRLFYTVYIQSNGIMKYHTREYSFGHAMCHLDPCWSGRSHWSMVDIAGWCKQCH